MHPDNVARLQEVLQLQGMQAALLSSPATITWLTGYAPPIQTGPSPFEGGAALAWWHAGEMTLLLSSDEAPAAHATGVATREYVGYSIEEPLDGVQRQAALLRQFLQESALGSAVVGVERAALTAVGQDALRAALPQAKFVPLDGALPSLRAIKAPEEIVKIRAALALSDLAQAEMAMRIAPGSSEIALWGQIKAQLEMQIGGRLPLLSDLVAGARTADIGGPPSDYLLQEGDPLIFDVVPRLNGYWGDNANTHFAGSASPEVARMREVVWDTLRWAIDTVKPGLVARDLDQAMRDAIRAAGYEPYPHHSGHGIGTTYHEEPRIVPYNEMQLQANMVIALEPGIYVPGSGGVRLEHVMLVTEDGCEVLTQHLPAR